MSFALAVRGANRSPFSDVHVSLNDVQNIALAITLHRQSRYLNHYQSLTCGVVMSSGLSSTNK